MERVKQGYRVTELGVMPDDWIEFKIQEIATVKRGASPRPIADPKWFGGSIGWVRIADVTASSIYLRETTDYLSDLGVELSVRVYHNELTSHRTLEQMSRSDVRKRS